MIMPAIRHCPFCGQRHLMGDAIDGSDCSLNTLIDLPLFERDEEEEPQDETPP
jgi:hypothetical protein